MARRTAQAAGRAYHDLGKVGMPGRPYHLPNPSNWHVTNRGLNCIVNHDLVHLDVATRNLMLVSRFITLTDVGPKTIRYHHGQDIDRNRSVAHRACRLTRLLWYADNWSGGGPDMER